MIKETKIFVEVNDVIKLIHNRATVEDLEPMLDDLKRLDWYEYIRTDYGYVLKQMDTK